MKFSLPSLSLCLLVTGAYAAPAALESSALEPVAIKERQATSCPQPLTLEGYRTWRVDNLKLVRSGSSLSTISFDVAQSATGAKSITCTRDKGVLHPFFNEGSKYDCGKFQADNYDFAIAGDNTAVLWLGHDSLRTRKRTGQSMVNLQCTGDAAGSQTCTSSCPIYMYMTKNTA